MGHPISAHLNRQGEASPNRKDAKELRDRVIAKRLPGATD
jgi:hypothetical protein